ncbi:phage tail protein [Pseudomonas faucium]|uniref:phage tail protein n=1 Tax=Pseudomonas faucium TaxID=2740518 RepID=UPI001F27FDB6|nr:tail fiber protein [Pseudomonas faucium]
MTDYFVGEIRLFAGDYAPVDFVICDGRPLQINDYQALYSLIGTTYGGDGQTTFNVPDLRGRVAVGTGTGTSDSGALTPRSIGQIMGTELVALTPTNTPSHSHTFNVTNSPANSAEAAGPSATNLRTFGAFTKQGAVTGLYSTSSPSNAVALNPGALVKAGGSGTPHNNMMPSHAINYIIAVQGLYPSQG